jgi:hypothetical protein
VVSFAFVWVAVGAAAAEIRGHLLAQPSVLLAFVRPLSGSGEVPDYRACCERIFGKDTVGLGVVALVAIEDHVYYHIADSAVAADSAEVEVDLHHSWVFEVFLCEELRDLGAPR